MQRPNIIFITSDQQRADCYGFEGRQVKTPHLDDMARAGTRFKACITPNLVCQPSRSSILTGLLPCTHGVSDNGIELPDEVGEKGFAGALTLTHSASLYLIGAANITTVAEDVADFLSLGSGNWKMTGYSRALTTSVTASQISDSTASGRALLTAASAAAQVALLPIPYDIVVAISDESTAITTGTAKVTIRAPRAMTLSTVLASLNTVSSSGIPTFDINVNGSTILSTKLTIDASEKTSVTAATPVVLSGTAIAADDEITFDIDVAGTGAKGAKIVLKGTTP